jgi:hypothetical protein
VGHAAARVDLAVEAPIANGLRRRFVQLARLGLVERLVDLDTPVLLPHTDEQGATTVVREGGNVLGQVEAAAELAFELQVQRRGLVPVADCGQRSLVGKGLKLTHQRPPLRAVMRHRPAARRLMVASGRILADTATSVPLL